MGKVSNTVTVLVLGVWCFYMGMVVGFLGMVVNVWLGVVLFVGFVGILVKLFGYGYHRFRVLKGMYRSLGYYVLLYKQGTSLLKVLRYYYGYYLVLNELEQS